MDTALALPTGPAPSSTSTDVHTSVQQSSGTGGYHSRKTRSTEPSNMRCGCVQLPLSSSCVPSSAAGRRQPNERERIPSRVYAATFSEKRGDVPYMYSSKRLTSPTDP